MRRIIERVVTVVTTTTWKISWETDPPQPSAEPGSDSLPGMEFLPEFTPTGPTVIETKEADQPKEENAPDQS